MALVLHKACILKMRRDLISFYLEAVLLSLFLVFFSLSVYLFFVDTTMLAHMNNY